MKYLFVTLFSIGLLFSICSAEEKLELKDQKSKESYSLGYQDAQALKGQGLDINLDVYFSGMKDFFNGKQPAMTEEEIRTTLSELQKRVAAAYEKELKEIAARNLGPSLVFLEENKKKPGVKVLPSGVEYKVITKGTGKTPKLSDFVIVNYIASLMDGTEFDNTYKRGQAVTLAVNGVIPGWKEALQLMKVGGKWQIFIPPSLAYGERGMGPVPPNSALIYEVELVSVR